MRISTAWAQQSALNNILTRESSLSTTESHLASGKSMLNASDNPVAAAQSLGLERVNAANQQYQRNITSGTSQLNAEEDALGQVTTLLQRARSLALEGNNATEDQQDRESSASELKQLFSQLLQVANGTNGQNEAVFAGNKTQVTPFVQGNGYSVTYQGDGGQRQIAVAPGMRVAAGDPGSTVFMDVPAGNGKFAVTAGPLNTGTLVVGQNAVSNPASFVGGTYTVTFGTAGAWQATNSVGTTVATGTYAGGGGSLDFNGMQIRLNGTPANGDTLQIQSNQKQSMFQTLGNLINAFDNMQPGAASSNVVNRQIEGLDQALGSVGNVQAQVGARLDTLQQQGTEAGDLSVLYQGDLSNLQDLNMPQAISQLNLQTVALQAAQQAYLKVQGLSLFNFMKG